MARRISIILAALAVAAAVGLAAPAPAHAAPARANSSNESVYFIHGYALGSAGLDVCRYWCPMIYAIDEIGWAGLQYGVAFYAADTNFSARMSNATKDTPIWNLSRDLAWMIYNNESAHGRSVDLVGHSMGGLIIRGALTGVARHDPAFPPFLYVEDVVTLGTPHGGTTELSVICTTRQCRDMRPGSDFLAWLAQGPQSTQGTDWTLIGSRADLVVTEFSAIQMTANVGHTHRYQTAGMDHMDLITTASGAHRVHSWHHHTRVPQTTENAYSPAHATRVALFFWRFE